MSTSLLFEKLNFLILVAADAELPIAHSTRKLLMDNSCNNCQIYELYNENFKDVKTDKDWFMKKFGPQTVHFVISNTINFPFYKVVYFDLLIPVVSHTWVQDSVKTKRHLRTNMYSPNPFHLLRDCQVYISKSSFNKCEYILYSDLLHLLGGTLVNYISNRTTHVIVQSPQDPIIATVSKLTFGSFSSSSTNKHTEKPLREWKFVYPIWILYHFKMAKPLKGELATLCELDMQDTSEEQLFAKWEEVIGDKQTSSSQLTLHPNKTLFKNHHFAISPDLNFFTPLYWFLKGFIEDLDGKVTPLSFSDDLKSVYQAFPDIDCYIGHSANSPILEKTKSIKPEIHVGNVSWLFYMFALQKFTPVSQCKLIHQPFHAKLFTSKELTVAYTNYFGSQRFYIQRLVEILGGLSTPELTRKNTHLITKSTIGKKFKVAKKWSLDPQNAIIVTNHMWLEQCYMNNSKLNPKDSRFQNFKLDDNMGWNIGQIGMDHSSLPTPKNLLMVTYDTQSISEKPPPTNDQMDQINDNTNVLSKKDGTPISSFENSIDEKIDKLQKISGEVAVTHSGDLERSFVSRPSRASFPVVDSKKSNLQKKDSNSDISMETEVFCEGHEKREEKEFTKPITEYDAPKKQEIREQSRKKNDIDYKKEEEETELQVQLGQRTKREIKTSKKNEKEKETNECHIEIDQMTNEKQGEESTGKLISTEDVTSKKDTDKFSHLFEGLSDNDDHINDEKPAVNSKYTTPKTSQNITSGVDTPTTAQTQVFMPSSGNSRLAKTQAAKRLHTDIESLNEFQKNFKRKRIDSEEISLSQDVERSNNNKELATKAEKILARFNELPNYDLKAVCTGCFHDGFNEVDIEILNQLGIKIFDNMKETDKLNCIFAPKILRTEKFLKSLSFEPLKFALKPEFIIDLLKQIHSKKDKLSQININLFDYEINGINESIISKTKLPTKVFERANIRCINLVNDIPGGVDTIGSVLKAHGIEKINVLRSKKCTFEDIIPNDVSKQENGGIFKYVLIATKASQVKKFTKLINDRDKNETILIVEWNWCVESIFHLNVDFTSKKNVLYQKKNN